MRNFDLIALLTYLISDKVLLPYNPTMLSFVF